MDTENPTDRKKDVAREDIWQSHSLKFLEMAFRTDRQERLFNADGQGRHASACGDSIEFFIVIQENRIDTISYALKGCINTNACANAVLELVNGQQVETAWSLKPEQVSEFLESLGEPHFHCAELAVSALHAALSDARDKRRSPWKKMYHK